MSRFDIELVGKIGSMAIINKVNNDVDYNVLSAISRELRPGYVWVTSGATEIGRIDYIKRNGGELSGSMDEVKTDYAAQGQTVLMETYRRFIDSKFSVRQFLVEHHHFNDSAKCQHLKSALLRCPAQNAIPIINYNDPVSCEENRKMEIQALKRAGEKVVECIDNDETAAKISCLLKPKYLLILSSLDGIYRDVSDPDSLIPQISGANTSEVLDAIEYYKDFCSGASRVGANGAKMKLEYIKEPVKQGTTVIIASSRYKISDILSKNAPSTVISVR